MGGFISDPFGATSSFLSDPGKQITPANAAITAGIIAAPFTGGASLGLSAATIAGTAGAAYLTTSAIQGKTGAPNVPVPPTVPKPPPAATPATLANASGGATGGSTSGKPPPTTAAGTIGTLGPQGLTTPISTAPLTLLGGTK